jgi:hypothetical protein
MRKVIQAQMMFGETDISAVVIDRKSRDDIPQILRGLQHIYTEPEVRERVFEILREVLPTKAKGEGKADPDNGRPGMEQWKILVLGVLRLALNIDYDRVQELANQHSTIRQMLGHSDWSDHTYYEVQTLKDNLRLFTPEILDRINQEVVRAGHGALKKSPDPGHVVRCDSFVVETNVHYPTDINLLFDAVRKTIETCMALCEDAGRSEWRQGCHQIRQFKKRYRHAGQLKRSRSKDETQRGSRRAEVEQAHRDYVELARTLVERARQTRRALSKSGRIETQALLLQLDNYLGHAERQIDQIERRVLQGETIAHEEKVFSIFQPHTEWISKGKAGVPVELGLRVAVAEDRHGFILRHRVMQKTSDEQIAVPLIEEIKARFGTIAAVSFDKGFHSPENQAELAKLARFVVLPRKGRLSEAEQEAQAQPEFMRLRRQHSAVESAINALEVHGLDRCPDHGMVGFERYVALAVVGRNVQRLGALLRAQEAQRRRGPYKRAA